MSSSKVIELNGKSYKINTLPPSRAIKLLSKITKIVGAPMALMAGNGGNEEVVEELIPKAMMILVDKLDEDMVLNILKEMMTCVFVDNKSIAFETEFMGNLETLFDLAKEVLEVNYSGFLGKISGLMT